MDTNDKNYIQTTKSEFYKLKKEFFADFTKNMNMRSGGITGGLHDPREEKRLQERIDKWNNPIELEFD